MQNSSKNSKHLIVFRRLTGKRGWKILEKAKKCWKKEKFFETDSRAKINGQKGRDKISWPFTFLLLGLTKSAVCYLIAPL
jgi:hypothetical protein